ncbi:hypothetical protein GCM10028796_06260 [Ramlibacter monticola]|uniref:Uncharacterized protein n=1 Tax=Ramlibacter monticola TaxID=1926872 RepID=A0A936Z018_9BURK|nr:hypothetical protein [Ramlibacter monticola]MBL0391105.1 hypothetical protein [Ramlibacter monticola]
MNDPVAAREALMIEAIGEAGSLIESVRGLTPVLQDIGREIGQADASLRETLASFEGRMAAITENAKTRTVQHLAARADEAARRLIEQQGRAMADAARVAFGAELGATIQRLRSALQPLIERPNRRWEQWLMYVAVAAVASATTWAFAVSLGAR